MTILYDRDEPCQRLRSLADSVIAGQGAVGLISGEAGIGKTSLLRWFVEHQTSCKNPLLVWWGACDALTTPRPLGPLEDMLLQMGNCATPIIQLVRSGAPIHQLFGLFAEAIVQQRTPVALIFEDLHWADSSTIDLIKFLGRRVDYLPLLLLASYRDDEPKSNQALRTALADMRPKQIERIVLRPLELSSIKQLSFGNETLARQVLLATSGNPFYVTEVLASRLSHGQAQVVPSTVADAVLSRVESISPQARQLLQRVSLSPGSMPLDLLASMPEIAQELTQLDDLIQGGLLRVVSNATNARYAVQFRHELARMTIQESVPYERRKTWHYQLAQQLIHQQSHKKTTAQTSDLARLAYHALESEEVDWILTYCPLAAQEAARIGAHQQAAAHWANALRFERHATLELRAAMNENWSYEAGISISIDEAVIQARKTAIELYRELKNPHRVGANLRWLSRLYWYQSQGSLARQFAQETIDTLEPLGPSNELAMAYSMLSQIAMLANDEIATLQWADRALAIAEQFNNAEVRIHALTNIGSIWLSNGKWDEGEAKMQLALAQAKEHQQHEQAARVYTNLSTFLVDERRYSRAELFIAEGIAFDRHHDLDSWTYYLQGVQARLMFEMGRYSTALEIANDALRVPGQTSLMQLPAVTCIARIKVRTGSPDALDYCLTHLATAESTGEYRRIVPFWTALMEFAWMNDNTTSAKQYLDKILDDGSDRGPWFVGQLHSYCLLLDYPYRHDHPKADQYKQYDVLPVPYRYELTSRWSDAAIAWQNIGAPYEQGLASLAQGDLDGCNAALAVFEQIGALAAVAVVKRRALQLGLRGLKRGHYSAAKSNDFLISAKEMAVLALLVQGCSNSQIAEQLQRSSRTVENHVASILTKLGASSRTEAVTLAHRYNILGVNHNKTA